MTSYDWLQSKFDEFAKVFPELLEAPEGSIVDPYDKDTTYFKSVKYLHRDSGFFHTSHIVEGYISAILDDIDEKQNIIDVGCAMGHTGIKFIEDHYVTFYDFAGIGLLFLQWLKMNQKYSGMTVLPYGGIQDEEERTKHEKFDIVLAFDVLEHTGNHLGFLKWIENLGNKVYLCFPYVNKYYPPYIPRIDEWVDVDTICDVIHNRYKNVDMIRTDGRIYIEYNV